MAFSCVYKLEIILSFVGGAFAAVKVVKKFICQIFCSTYAEFFAI